MLSALKFITAAFVFAAIVSASPNPNVADVKAGYIGTGNINLQGAANHVVEANHARIHDAAQGVGKFLIFAPVITIV